MSAAVLLLAHGTPDSPAEVPAYMKNITGGRPIPAEVMQEVQHRYGLIGPSPLTQITLRQAAALREQVHVPVYVGMRNWHPFIADVVKQIMSNGITHVVALCLAPHNSRTSVGLYRRALEQAAGGGLEIHFIAHWHDEPLLIDAFAERLSSALPDATTPIIFTAHSVPCKTICADESGAGDPYSTQAKHTAELIARKLGIADERWFFAFQSQGMSGATWIGPTVEATLDALAKAGHRRVLIQPIGFVCDHVEVLYDIDIAFKEYAAQRGMELGRTASLNDSPTFIAALAHVIQVRIAAMAV
ncbi:MAG TPA: ferrochelatase [Terriglobales bacterium]|nr:ferrochelatase [Terriglobales bacterium]